jgi:hypothetical protein
MSVVMVISLSGVDGDWMNALFETEAKRYFADFRLI